MDVLLAFASLVLHLQLQPTLPDAFKPPAPPVESRGDHIPTPPVG